MRDIHKTLIEQIKSGEPCALATLVRAAGSTPQKPGSSALFGEQGLVAGTVGGGILESEAQKIAESLMISGASDHFYFNLDADQNSDGAICGGEAEVLIDASPSDHLAVFQEMERALSRRTEGYLLTVLGKTENGKRSLRRFWIPGADQKNPPMILNPAFDEQVIKNVKPARRYGFKEIDLGPVPQMAEMAYLEHIKPMPHLIIAGGGHIGQALAHLGAILDFEVSVVDDRPEYANAHLFPDADHLVVQDIGPAMSDFSYGPDTYVVIVTRGHRQDGEALKSCIGSDAAYIGMIGSAHKVGIMKKQFIAENWATREQWASLHAPVGLDIGSQTVQEIAISIAAQLVGVRNRKKTEQNG